VTRKKFINPWAADAEEKLAAKTAAPQTPAPNLADIEEEFARPKIGVHVIAPGYGGFVSSEDASAGEALARLAKGALKHPAALKTLAGYAVEISQGAVRPEAGFFVYDAPTKTLLRIQGVTDRASAMFQIVQGLLALDRDPYTAVLLRDAGITPYRK